jgi:predicted Zn-dependent protease
MALLADRRARLSDPAHADTAEAQIILGQTLLAAGHPAAARRHLEEAADTRRSRPAHGWTLVLLARAVARLGDTQRAAQAFRSVTGLAAAGVDPCHPVILTARCDEAERRTAVGDTRQAARLLAPVLDRTLLVHGRPALGEPHPLLTRARTLAERLGITVPYTLPGLDEASLDLDV